MSRWARKRDTNENAIIAALKNAGASVQQLDETGVPDLLVCYRGVLFLLEVKDIDEGRTRPHKRSDGPVAELTPAQQRWWLNWRGPVFIVHTTVEALRAIGAMV